MVLRLMILVCFSIPQAFSAEIAQPLTTRDGITLSGVLTSPAEAPAAIALLLPGSGNVGLDGDVSSPFVGAGYRGARANLSEQLAAVLAANGVASYRYAKRGFEAPAELPHQTFDYLLRDAEDALRLLRATAPEARIILVGFSEGALLATYLAARARVEGLFLLGLPSRPIDETFDYQFVQWPVELLRRRLDLNHDGLIDAVEQALATTLPIVGAPLAAADLDHDGVISIAGELAPFHQGAYLQLRGLLADPSLAHWYQAMVVLPAFSAIAPRVTAPVYLYHGAQDPQVNALWALSDSRYFPKLRSVRLFEDAGHAFAPLDGVIGEVKTSGPLSEALLSTLTSDIRASLFP